MTLSSASKELIIQTKQRVDVDFPYVQEQGKKMQNRESSVLDQSPRPFLF
jgi:hypothetical protein